MKEKTGDLGVVKTIFGFHIIEIEGQTDKIKAIQVGTIAREIEPSEATTAKVFRDASNFEINAGNGDFEALAKEGSYVVRPVNGMKILDESIPVLEIKDQLYVGLLKRMRKLEMLNVLIFLMVM